MKLRSLSLALLLLPACGDSAKSANPNDDGGSSNGDATYPDVCVNREACVSGHHPDPVLCKCVPDADADVDATSDAVSEATSDATTGDANDARVDSMNIGQDGEAGAACPSIDTYCAPRGDVRCVLTWSAAMMPASFCGANSRVLLYPNCQGYDILVDAGVDTAVVYYYDRSTSALVAIEHRGLVPPGSRCVATSVTPIPSTDLSTCSDGHVPSSICEGPREAGND